MTIIEAITNLPEEVTELNQEYVARIYIDGNTVYEKPVDIRLNRVRLPLTQSDISFIYDNEIKKRYIHRADSVCKHYYPIGSNIRLNDGTELKIISYNIAGEYNDRQHIDLYCKLANEENTFIENINTTAIKDRILQELNIMIESNEVIKNLLPQYSYDWIKFDNNDIDNIKKFNSSKLLRLIDKIEADERRFYMDNIVSISDTAYTTYPPSFYTFVNKISKIDTKKKIEAGFMGVHSFYNPRYVLEWLIYISENSLLNDDITLTDEFYTLNNSGLQTKISVNKKNVNDYIIQFMTPSDCDNDYLLTLEGVSSMGSYIEYNISSLKLEAVEKNPTEVIVKRYTEIENNSDLLETATQIVSIIAGTNIPENTTMREYYQGIDILLSSITSELVSNTTPIEDDGREEEN